MNAIRPDGATVVREFGLDPNSMMVRRKVARRPHEDWFHRGAISAGRYEAANRYVVAYERGLLGARNIAEPSARPAAESFHEAKANWLHILMRAQEALRAHERTVLDCTMLSGMTLEAYGREMLRVEMSPPMLRGMVMGLVLSALDTLCEHWGITA